MSEFLFWRGGAPERFVSRAVRRANDEVFDKSHARSELSRMQTTLTTVVLERDTLAVGHAATAGSTGRGGAIPSCSRRTIPLHPNCFTCI